MAVSISKVESKLREVVRHADCVVCAQLIGRCPSCGRSIGAVPAEADFARATASARLDAMHDCLARFPDGVIRPTRNR